MIAFVGGTLAIVAYLTGSGGIVCGIGWGMLLLLFVAPIGALVALGIATLVTVWYWYRGIRGTTLRPWFVFLGCTVVAALAGLLTLTPAVSSRLPHDTNSGQCAL